MSGICAIVLRDSRNRLERSHMPRMVHALNISSKDEGFTLNFGCVGIGVQKFTGRISGVAELSMHEQPYGLGFHGTLYNSQELFSSNNKNFNPFLELLRFYLKEGMEFLQRLRGDFVLVIWDGLKETLQVATDRFRVHPLFYYEDQDKLVVSSRMHGILACPFPVNLTIDPTAVVDVIGNSIIPTPKTVFREVRKLPPGHHLTYKSGKTLMEPYWKVTFLQPSTASESTLAGQFRAHFTEAISSCLAVDGNSNSIGTFLSGGIDSSSVTGVLTQLVKSPVKSFSIGFGEEKFNEINYARIAAQAFGAKHFEYFVTPSDTLDMIPTLIEGIDEPYGNASAIPVYFCAKMAKDHGVDVLYAGDGGDELFAGNKRYARQHLLDYFSKVPASLRESILTPAVFALADRLGCNLFIKGKKYILRASIPYHERITSYNFFKVVSITDFLEDGLLEKVGRDYNPYAPFSFYFFQAPAKSNLDRHLYIDWFLTVSDNDLLKFRTAEAAGVSVRFPFLDHRLAEFSTNVPAHIKMRGRRLRSFQKKAYADLLPQQIIKKKKHGFGLPISTWLRTDKRLNELMHDLVLSRRSLQRGYFRSRALQNLVDDCKTDKTSFYGTVLWNLMVLELWHRHVYDRAP